jgi:acetoin utilization deacetylase AcuC-like enzyme
MNVSEAGFAAMASALMQAAEKYAGGRIAFLLEGGYDLQALKNSVAAVLRSMQDPSGVELADAEGPAIEPLVRRILRVQEKYRRF